jgi:hypothetical protein
MIKFYRLDLSSSCSTALFGTERVFIERRVIGAVVDDTLDCSVDREGIEGEVSCWLVESISFSSLISSMTFRLGFILFIPLLLLIEFLGEK